MNYKETIEYLFSQLPMFQRIGGAAYKANLDNTIALDEHFFHPHRKFKSIHIAGTNGKGSVSHYIASVLQSAGYKTGLYTSPHLKDFRERIKIDGKMIPEQFVIKFVEDNKRFFETIKPSFFEMTVAMAFEYFAKEHVDIAVIEVGMGGRLDSTNIIKPLLSVITNISYDHTQFLGDTLEKIAIEKAGIIKKEVPVVVGEATATTRHIFIQKAEELDSQLFLASHNYSANTAFNTSDGMQSFNINKNGKLYFNNLRTELLGDYQKFNIPTVLQSLEVLQQKGYKITQDNIFDGIAKVCSQTGLLGRWQILNKTPLTICDVGHNEAGILMITNQLKITNYKKLHFILGTVNDKQVDKILKLLPKDANYYFTQASIPRALPAQELMQQASDFGLTGSSSPTVKDAFESAKRNAQTSDLIFIGGSTFIVAEII